MIEGLVRDRLFVRPTGDPGVWRFHRLFLRAARRELRAGSSATAARWPNRLTRDPAAVSRRFLAPHAVLSSLTDDMLDNELLAAHAVDLLLDGALEPPSSSTLMRTASSTPLSRAAIGLAALAAGDLGAAELALEGLDEPRDPVSGDLASVSRLLRARHGGDLDATAEAANGIESTAPDDGRRALAWLELGTLEFDLGRDEQAEEHLELAASLADHARRWSLAGRAWAALALLAASGGRLRDAEARLELVDYGRVPSAEVVVRASLARAVIGFLRDDLEGAARHAEVGRDAAGASWDPLPAVYALVTEIAILEAQGQDELATARLAEAEELRLRCPAGFFQIPLLDLFKMRLLERAGRAQEAADLLARLERRDHPFAAMTMARRSIADDDPAAALKALQRLPHGASPGQLLLYAAAVDRIGDGDASHEALERALGMAEAEGIRRPFIDEGVPVRALLEQHLERATAHAAFITDLLDHMDVRRPAPDGELRSPLTERELVVLGHLPSEMTARDIADALTVSETTVRTHLRHIYGKLDADGRRDAVRRARELRLLSPQ